LLVVLLVCAGSISAQTAPAPAAHPAQTTQTTQSSQASQASAPRIQVQSIDAKLQEALRERDAIIRNLLERVSELEWRMNGGFTTPAKPDERPVLTPASASRAVTSVVSDSTYDTTERQATEALDQALIVRGGLLLPSGMLEVDNTLSYFSSSSDHLTVNGFALLPILVVGDITSQRTRANYVLPTFTSRLGLPGDKYSDKYKQLGTGGHPGWCFAATGKRKGTAPGHPGESSVQIDDGSRLI